MNLANISSSLDSFVGSFQGESKPSTTYQLTDKQIQVRKIVRWSILSIVILAIAFVLIKKYRK